jgi:hypothetical protein
MVLCGKQDQYVPDFVDIVSVVEKWEATYRAATDLSAEDTFNILQDANHELADER